MATQKTTKKRTTSGPARPAPKREPAAKRPRPVMPVWLQNTLIGLIIFTLTLRLGLLPQVVVCALALGLAVWQIWGHRARWLWTWTSLVAVGLYLLGVYLATQTAPAWFLYFGAWIFVIVAFVGEGSRAVRGTRGTTTG
ncbi:MAG TPA: hypothetical protein VIK03_09080 [Thermoleophilia bacterium]